MTIRTLLFSLTLVSTAALASESAPLQDNRAVVQVKGVVCSFCAHGTEKNLGKLDFLDKSEYGGDGVLLDIDTHRITLALDPVKPMDFSAIHKAIVDGGYDPVNAHVRVHGRIERRDDAVILTCPANGQSWRLEGKEIDALSDGQELIVEGEIAAAEFAEASASAMTPLAVTGMEQAQ